MQNCEQEKRLKKKKKNKYKFLIVGFLFIIVIVYVGQSVMIWRLNYQIKDLQRKIGEYETENASLKNKLNSQMNTKKISRIAQQQLNMCWPQPQQIIIVYE